MDGKTYEVIRGVGMYKSHDYYSSSNGTSTETIICPFCETEIEVYRWSFCGCGKRCECGAKLELMTAYKEVKKQKQIGREVEKEKEWMNVPTMKEERERMR